jgi:hypothetical protein
MKFFFNRFAYLTLLALSLLFVNCESNDNILEDDILTEGQNTIIDTNDPELDREPIDLNSIHKLQNTKVGTVIAFTEDELVKRFSKPKDAKIDLDANFIISLYTEPNYQGGECHISLVQNSGTTEINLATKTWCGIDFNNKVKSYRRRGDTEITFTPEHTTPIIPVSYGSSSSPVRADNNVSFTFSRISITVPSYKEPLSYITEQYNGTSDYILVWKQNRTLTSSAYDAYENHFHDVQYNMTNTELSSNGNIPICSLQRMFDGGGEEVMDVDAPDTNGNVNLSPDGASQVSSVLSSWLTTNFQNSRMSRCYGKARSCHAQGRSCQWGALDTQGRYHADRTYRQCVNLIVNTPGYQLGNSSYCTRNQYCVRTVNGAYTDLLSVLFDVI